MRQYGSMKATEFNRSQISAIYRNAKLGNLKVEKWFIKRLYDTADYYGYDDNRSMERFERYVLDIINEVFAGNLEKAQKLIDETTESEFKTYTEKYRNKFDRTFIG